MRVNTGRKRLVHPTRRQALAMAGVCSSAYFMRGTVHTLLSSLVNGMIGEARASRMAKPRNYVHLNLAGGPCRWFFDLPLRPYDSSGGFIADPQVVTRFDPHGALEYHTTPVTKNGVTLNMPSIWETTIPTPGGVWVPMAGLLENMLMIRGVNMQADGHPPNNFKQVRPAQNMPSLTGLVADASDTPIPAFGGSPNTPFPAYKSKKGLGQVTIPLMTDHVNPLAQILGPFDAKADGPLNKLMPKKAALAEATKQALNALGEYAKSNQPGAENLFQLRGKAEKLLQQGLGDIEGVYQSLYRKYHSLIENCKMRNMVGINNLPIPHSAFPRLLCRTVDTKEGKRVIATNSDLRDIITEKTRLAELAEGFAVAEYLLLNGLSASILWGITGVQNLFFENLASVQIDSQGNELGQTSLSLDMAEGSMPNDEHFTGNAISFVANNFLFRSVAACLYEFIAQLKGAGLFSETVIQLGAEFSRIPRKDFGGSEHGWMANCTSLFSGAIDRPLVLGNILVDGYDGIFNPRRTTWGMAAPVEVDGSRQELVIGHSTSTIASLLRVPPPLPNNGTLVVESPSGALSPTIELAKNKYQI